jgi:hypothetical protein
MTPQQWAYPPELADALLRFGLAPTPTTPPAMVRDALNDLYRFEIRRLKRRLLAGQVAKVDYTPQVILLRKKYWPLSLQPGHWETITRSAPVPTEVPPSGSAE